MVAGLVVFLLSGVLTGSSDPQEGPTEVGQAIADALRSYTSADGAFIPADLIGKPVSHSLLASALTYPKEHFATVVLTGAQIKTALEKSVLLYPEKNVGFLQVSGLEISFSKGAIPNSRVTSVSVDGSKLDEARKYVIAMPTSLEKGLLGYTGIWEKSKIEHNYDTVTMADVLAGKKTVAGGLRWLALP